MSEATHAYIGRYPCCGNVPCVTVDSDYHRKDTAREIASWIRDGLQVERVPIDDVRTVVNLKRCTCKKARA